LGEKYGRGERGEISSKKGTEVLPVLNIAEKVEETMPALHQSEGGEGSLQGKTRQNAPILGPCSRAIVHRGEEVLMRGEVRRELRRGGKENLSIGVLLRGLAWTEERGTAAVPLRVNIRVRGGKGRGGKWTREKKKKRIPKKVRNVSWGTTRGENRRRGSH